MQLPISEVPNTRVIMWILPQRAWTKQKAVPTESKIEKTLATSGIKLLNTKRRITITAIIEIVEIIEISKVADEELL